MADLGQKHECPDCGLKYYDLGKSDAVCPKCGDGSDSPDEEKKKVAKK
jgi:uncharacterized protein (TIGR02300 family)